MEPPDPMLNLIIDQSLLAVDMLFSHLSYAILYARLPLAVTLFHPVLCVAATVSKLAPYPPHMAVAVSHA